MMWSLRAQPEAVGVLSSRVEQALGIPAAHVEKDFWVTEALRAATDGARDEDVTLVFKGGTSLSKAHHLIRRFSEDVDLIVVVPAAKKAADQCLKRITEVVGEALGVEGQVDPTTATTGRKRTTSFEYPASQDSGVLRRGVVLELGARGGTLPAESMVIRSLIAEHAAEIEIEADFIEAEGFKVRVLHPTRTLVEKLMILHHAAVEEVKTERVRLVRHYYDVWCLLRDEATVRGFKDWPCDALAKEVQVYTEYAGLRTTPRPADGFAASPAFSERTRAVRKAFEQNVLSQLVWGPPDEKPSLDECCDLVQEMSGRL